MNARQEEIERLAREIEAEAEEEKARAQKKIKTNVVPFVPGSEEKKPSHPEILDQLVGMDDVEYDRCRRAKAREWGLRLETLDRMRKHAKLRQAYNAQQKEPELDVEATKHRLAYIWESENILDLWVQSWDKKMAGEHRNAKLLFLVATSRMFDRPMNCAIKGPSSAGKSEIRRQVLEFFPPEDRHQLHHDVGAGAPLPSGRLRPQNPVDGRGARLSGEGAARHAAARIDVRRRAALPGRAEGRRSARHAGHHQARSRLLHGHNNAGGTAS